MEIPGIAPLSGQPTLTNPLSQQVLLDGRQTEAKAGSEAQNTVTSAEQSSTSVNNAQIVNEVEEPGATGFDTNNPGGSIDITA